MFRLRIADIFIWSKTCRPQEARKLPAPNNQCHHTCRSPYPLDSIGATPGTRSQNKNKKKHQMNNGSGKSTLLLLEQHDEFRTKHEGVRKELHST